MYVLKKLFVGVRIDTMAMPIRGFIYAEGFST
jgi:hypothetical protein